MDPESVADNERDLNKVGATPMLYLASGQDAQTLRDQLGIHTKERQL
jgi:hypothetical protein